jgi:hypothetical protein
MSACSVVSGPPGARSSSEQKTSIQPPRSRQDHRTAWVRPNQRAEFNLLPGLFPTGRGLEGRWWRLVSFTHGFKGGRVDAIAYPATAASRTVVQYVPPPDFRGFDMFKYTLGNVRGRRASGKMIVIVADTAEEAEAIDARRARNTPSRALFYTSLEKSDSFITKLIPSRAPDGVALALECTQTETRHWERECQVVITTTCASGLSEDGEDGGDETPTTAPTGSGCTTTYEEVCPPDWTAPARLGGR